MPSIEMSGPGCSGCLGPTAKGSHCCYCDTDIGHQIEAMERKINRLEKDLQHWKSNHKYAVDIKRKVSDMYGKSLLENRILMQELQNEREAQRKGRQTTSFFNKLKRFWKET